MKRKWMQVYRKQLELKQSELAEIVGVSTRMIEYIESGQRNPSNFIDEKIANTLGFDVEMFDKNFEW